MAIFTHLIRLYRKIVTIGMREDLSFGEKLRIQMCNLSILLSILPMVMHLLYNFFGPNELREYLLPLSFFVLLGLSLILNHKGKYLLAKLNGVMTPLFMIATLHVCFGWGMRVEVMYLLFVLLGMFFFKQRAAFIVVGCILLIFALVSLKLILSGPIFEEEILPSAPLGYFLFAVINGAILTSKVLRESIKYRRTTLEQTKTLEAKNEELERFAYISSHDLKSPLRNIHSFAGLLERDLKRGTSENLEEYLDYIKTNSKHMSLLISDILEVSKINKEGDVPKAWVDLNEVVGQVKENLQVELAEKSGHIHCEDLPRYQCNEAQFSLLFQNFIQNGIKYNSAPTPTINIWATQENEDLLVHFQDNGIGIEEEYHDYIFEYFKRLHTLDEYEGTGIGLGLCKKIVEDYEGEIQVASAKDQGSTFTLKLPSLHE